MRKFPEIRAARHRQGVRMSNPFLTFPLCLLAMPARPKDPEGSRKRRLQHIVSYSLYRAGISSGAEKIDRQTLLAYAQERACGNIQTKEREAIVRGAIVCGVTIGSVDGTARQKDAATAFIDEHQAAYGTDPLVFVSTELFWMCHNDGEPSYRDFTLLCGINSMVGLRETPVLIRRVMLQARQLGYKSPTVMRAANPNATPLTVQQLRDALDRLELRGLL